jgi:predicted transcriptional regulator
MKKASQMMVAREKVVTLKPGDDVSEAVRKLASAGVSGAPVLEGETVVGIVSESDITGFLEAARKQTKGTAAASIEEAAESKVSSIMTKKVVSVGPDATLGEIAHLMADRKVNRIVVTDSHKSLLGIIARADVIKAGLEELQ